jgi:hypothetical protein
MSPDDAPPAEPTPSRWRGLRPTLIAIGVLIIAVAIVLVAFSIHGSSNASSRAASNTGASDRSASCTTGPAEAELRLTVYSGVGEAVCSQFNQEAAKNSGTFWKTKAPGEELSGELVCSMSKGGPLIEVRDTGEHLLGNRMCAGLTAKGWHEEEGPGAVIEREQTERKAESERTRTAEREAEEAREATKRQSEQETLEKEEAIQHHKEDVERATEDHERKSEERKYEQERARENRRTEEETHKAEQEASG